MASALAAIVLPRAASATPDWKDGCPAYFPVEKPPEHIANVPTNTGAGTFGVLPDLDSPLGSSRFGMEGWTSNGVQRREPDGGFANRILGLSTFGQLSLSSGLTVAGRYSGGHAWAHTDAPGYWQTGTLQLFVGYRAVGYLLGPMFRIGAAIRVGGGGAPVGGNDDRSIMKREELEGIAPFRAPQLAFDRPFGLSAEGRIELVGCQAPFLALRVDAWTWDGEKAVGRVVDVPVEVALGGYLLSWLAAFGSFGLDWRTPGSVLINHQTMRAGLGFEGQFWSQSLRVGAHIGGLRGDNLVGYDLGVVMSYWRASWQ